MFIYYFNNIIIIQVYLVNRINKHDNIKNNNNIKHTNQIVCQVITLPITYFIGNFIIFLMFSKFQYKIFNHSIYKKCHDL